jgi:hypothetical protein
MTADSYLQTILAREAVNTSLTSPVRGVQAILATHTQYMGWNTASQCASERLVRKGNG